MMNGLGIMTDIFILIWMHFVADFILQTNRIALNKSKNVWILLEHVLIYSISFCYFGLEFAIANMCLHFLVDFCTSRASSYFWNKDQRRWFFVVIGFDQALHMTCLIATYELFRGFS